MKTALIVVVWLAFTAFSIVVTVRNGYFGFIELAMREEWGLQVLLDLVIALSLFAGFVVSDAKRRGLRAWPWLVAIVTLGSIGALPYLLYRRRFKAL
jgi:hypothetical protein